MRVASALPRGRGGRCHGRGDGDRNRDGERRRVWRSGCVGLPQATAGRGRLGRARTLVTVGLGRPKQCTGCTASSQQPAAASHPTRAASCERRGGRDSTKPPRSGVRLSPRHRTVPMAGWGGAGPHFAGCSRPTGRADALPTGMDGFTETYCQTRQWRSQANHTGGSGRGCSLPVSHTLEGVPPWVPPACSSALGAYGKSPTGFRSCTASLSRAGRGGVEQQGEESF